MELKDIIGLIFTFLLLVFFQLLARPKKNKGRSETPPHPVVKKKEPASHHRPRPISAAPKQRSAEHTIRTSAPTLGHSHNQKLTSPHKKLFSSKEDLRTAFIMQEVLKRPYE